jgi:hypothetical protein
MYARTTGLLKLYIRNIMPDDRSTSAVAGLADRDGAKRHFSTDADIGVLRSSHIRSSEKLAPRFGWWHHACCGGGYPAVAEVGVACC